MVFAELVVDILEYIAEMFQWAADELNHAVFGSDDADADALHSGEFQGWIEEKVYIG